ncbi:MAG: hypothetical protein HKL84_01545, partial [Acidimicrobiaceae bacterium]|nr:hypothetical protein [Acidimicrobiaceae bacterium]
MKPQNIGSRANEIISGGQIEYRLLGRTGLSVSAVGFGCGSTGGLFVRGSSEAQRAAVSCAIEGGINYFDTAAQYGNGRSEANLGRTLSDLGASPYLGTKLHLFPNEIPDVTRIIRGKLTESLRRLGYERIDVCTLHTRVGSGPDELPGSDVVGPVADAMAELVSAGLAGAIGFTGLGETKELHLVASSGRFDVFQCYYNLLNPSASNPGSPDGISQDFDGLLNLAADHGIGSVGIRVLAGGALAGGESRHPLAGPIGNPMAKGEGYCSDLRRATKYLGYLCEMGVSSLAELAYRFAFTNQRISTVLGGFSDKTQVDQCLEFASRGPLP